MNGIEAAVAGRAASESIELRTAQSGKSWASFSVAVGEGDSVEFVHVSAFEDVAQRLAGELKKGDRVHCVGRLQLNRWKKDGIERFGLQLAAWKVEPLGAAALGRKRKLKAQRHHDAPPPANGQTDAAARDWQRPPASEVEIPF